MTFEGLSCSFWTFINMLVKAGVQKRRVQITSKFQNRHYSGTFHIFVVNSLYGYYLVMRVIFLFLFLCLLLRLLQFSMYVKIFMLLMFWVCTLWDCIFEQLGNSDFTKDQNNITLFVSYKYSFNYDILESGCETSKSGNIALNSDACLKHEFNYQKTFQVSLCSETLFSSFSTSGTDSLFFIFSFLSLN